MTPPYEQPGPNIAFWLLILLFALGEYVMRFRARSYKRGSRQVERWSFFVVVASALVGVVGGFELARWNATVVHAGRWPLFVLGLLFMAGGLVVRQWAILVLGRFFTVDVRVQPDQTVVERGPYRWVRHPSYTGLMFFFVGLGLALANWASLILLAVLPTAGLLVRIRSEERALTLALGDDYARYATTHRRLFPGIW
ncbi:MAG: methyltransferase family protein [Gaiellaceae bacterium]